MRESDNFYKLIKKSINTFNSDFSKNELETNLKIKYKNC